MFSYSQDICYIFHFKSKLCNNQDSIMYVKSVDLATAEQGTPALYTYYLDEDKMSFSDALKEACPGGRLAVLHNKQDYENALQYLRDIDFNQFQLWTGANGMIGMGDSDDSVASVWWIDGQPFEWADFKIINSNDEGQCLALRAKHTRSHFGKFMWAPCEDYIKKSLCQA